MKFRVSLLECGRLRMAAFTKSRLSEALESSGRLIDGWMIRRMMDGWMDGWMDRWMIRRMMDGWMDG